MEDSGEGDQLDYLQTVVEDGFTQLQALSERLQLSDQLDDDINLSSVVESLVSNVGYILNYTAQLKDDFQHVQN